MTDTTITLTDRIYAGESDLQPLCDMLNACDAVDQQDDNYAVEDLRIEFGDPRLDPANDLRIWQDAEGQITGFGQLWIDRDGEKTDGHLYFKVLPEARGNGLDDAIISWASERLRAVAAACGKPAQFGASAREEDGERRALLEQHGFAPERYFFRMVRPLDQPIPEAEFPAGITLQHSAGVADAERWIAAYNNSFIDHWSFHPGTVELHSHYLADPKYRSDIDLIAVTSDSTIAAFCFCFIDPDDNARNNRSEGWINRLGTQRGFRKQGLGSAMLLAGMRALQAAGVAVAKLGVDAQNPTGALRLYEAVGFEKAHTNVAYGKEI